MFVFRVEYKIEDTDENWKTYVLADTEKDSIEFITNYLKKRINVIFVDQYNRVDGISDSIISRVIEKHKKLEEMKNTGNKEVKDVEDKSETKPESISEEQKKDKKK